MIRIPLINPFLLLLAAHARLAVEAIPGDSWQGLAALRENDFDIDSEYTLINWHKHWSAGTRQSFEAAHQHIWMDPLGTQVQPNAIAQSLSKTSGVPFANVCVLPWAINDKRYAPELVDQMVEAKNQGKQVWLDVPAINAAQAAQDSLVRDGLRLGCSWFLRPPNNPHQQEAYVKALRAWTHQILGDASFDQWVWPWGEIMIKGMAAYASTGAMPKRQGPPVGWPEDNLRWPSLTRDVIQGVFDNWGNERIACDLFMGLIGAFPPPQ